MNSMSFAHNSQDWGGRRKLNPDNIPKIKRSEIIQLANNLGVEIRREGKGMWMIKSTSGTWYTLGLTNYIALRNLQNYNDFSKMIK